MNTARVSRLDPTHPLPLHAQAEQRLRELIAGPGFKPGALLPDEVSLAAKMGVSRNTLRAAIARLALAHGHLANRLSHNPAPAENQPDLNLCQK